MGSTLPKQKHPSNVPYHQDVSHLMLVTTKALAVI